MLSSCSEIALSLRNCPPLMISQCSVALRSILGTDFIFGPSDIETNELDALYHQASTQGFIRPSEEAVFSIIVRPAVPEEGLTLQVGSSCSFFVIFL